MTDMALILSLISLGFFGGFSHCIGMCGPFVITQTSNRLQKIKIENFSNFERLKNLALLPYHFGRITTYSTIGFCCSFITKNIQDFFGFRIISGLFLLGAAWFFLKIFLEKNQLPKGALLNIKNLMLKLAKNVKIEKGLKNSYSPAASKNHKPFSQKFSFFLSALFQSPQGFKGYFLGVILGFIPCGLLYGAFMISATISNPILAFFGMFLFGISTFPALFIAGFGGYFLTKTSGFKFVTKTILLLNCLMLLLMAVKVLAS